MAMVIVTSDVDPPNDGEGSVSFAVPGATTQAATDLKAVDHYAPEKADIQASTVTVDTELAAGSNTFTLQYKSEGGTTKFGNRTISVIPLG